MKRETGWPRYMKQRRLRSGGTAFYWQPQGRDIAAGFTLGAEALGTDYAAACLRAAKLNEHLDAWRAGRGVPAAIAHEHKVGTVDWWHHEYFSSEAFTKRKPRTKSDYREALAMIADHSTSDGRRLGDLPAASLSQAAVDKLYARLRDGGRVNRQADYAMDVARRAWKIVARAHPGHFLIPVIGADGKAQRLAINPFEKMVRAEYERETAKPATREEAVALAAACVAIGHPAIGVAALVCYEWLQRPEDVRRGRLTWADVRPPQRPREVLIWHHKNRKRVWQPLDALSIDPQTGDEIAQPLYPELEALLASVPRLGVSLVMFTPQRGSKDASGNRTARLYSEPYAQHVVQAARKHAGLAPHVTLEACRHGGMTELGDAGLTEQEIMSLSGHATPAAARLYVKRTEQQRLAAAIKRRAAVERGTKSG